MVRGGKVPHILSHGIRCECSASRPGCFTLLFELNRILEVLWSRSGHLENRETGNRTLYCPARGLAEEFRKLQDVVNISAACWGQVHAWHSCE